MSALRDLIRPHRWWPLLLVAFTGKALLLSWMLHEHRATLGGRWYAASGDSAGYLGPIESLLQGHGYFPDHRMPGYGAPYLLLRLVLERTAAFHGIVWLQVAASALAVVLLAKLVFLLSSDDRAFHLTFWSALVATYTSYFDQHLTTESFSSMALVLSAYCAVKYLQGSGMRTLLFAGTAITWLIFMKPVYLPILAILAIAVFKQRSMPLLSRAGAVLLLGTPFLLVDGAWCTRNAMVHGEFRPLTDGTIYPDLRASIRYPLIRLMQAYGTSYTWWDPSAEIRWFNIRFEEEGQPQFADRQVRLPAYVHTLGCPEDSLKRIADEVGRYSATKDTVEKARLLSSVSGRCDRCIGHFRQEKPLHYQVTARFRMLKAFLIHSGTSALMADPFALLDPVRMLIRAFYSFLYLGAMLGGIFWAIRSLFTRTLVPGPRLVSALLLYGVCIFPLGMRMTEFRYSTTFYPLALMFAVLPALDAWDTFGKPRARNTTAERMAKV